VGATFSLRISAMEAGVTLKKRGPCAGIMARRFMASAAKPVKKKRVARPRTAAERQARIHEILRRLDNMYPDVKPPLYHRTPWELLVATILSAQSTDKLVKLGGRPSVQEISDDS